MQIPAELRPRHIFKTPIERHQDSIFLDRQPKQIRVCDLLMPEDPLGKGRRQRRPTISDRPETITRTPCKVCKDIGRFFEGVWRISR